MSLAYFATLLDQEEHIRGLVYPSARFYIFKIFTIIALSWGSLYGYFFIADRFPSLAFPLLLVAQALALLLVIRLAMRLKYTAWVITNDRLLDVSQQGVLQHEINEEYMDDLYRPTKIYTSIKERLFGLATIRMYVIHERSYLEISGVSNADAVVEFLRTLVVDPADAKERLKKLRAEHVADDAFDDLLDEMANTKDDA